MHKAAALPLAHAHAIIPACKRQRGMATLVTALVLLIAVTLITFNVAKVSSVEQRISANDARTLAAHETAQAAIEQGLAYLNANLPRIDPIVYAYNGSVTNTNSMPWALCTTAMTSYPCGNGQSNQYDGAWLYYTVPASRQISLPGSPYTTTIHYLTKSVGGLVDVAEQPRIIILAVAVPTSDPLAGSAVIQQIVQYFSFVTVPPSPLAALGQVELKGNIGVYGNPAPAASFYPPLQTGRPLSVWSGSPVIVSGSAVTCLPGSDCGGGETNGIPHKLTDKTTNGGDIAASDPNFPATVSDLFQHIFGVPSAEASTIKNKSTVLADCSSLTSASSGLFWVTSSCTIPASTGSATAPAIMVVEGDFTMNSSHTFYGLIYSKGSGTVKLTGGPTLWGGIVSDHAVDIGAGTYTMRYLDLSRILGNNTGGFAKVPGGWLDTYQKPVS